MMKVVDLGASHEQIASSASPGFFFLENYKREWEIGFPVSALGQPFAGKYE